ncbi:proline iminopeptidase-family hydrolase [Halovivax gelatinilyticus]|uniref:proline iminopeptidase-family hydrolase n=1 Tax=Halovivax gelatinilyticus TaxID=2961597 RepID=UPI0020CA4630|nr:proline iminopeptidase-family hydrolase [Halovivax gelatinilyticus]
MTSTYLDQPHAEGFFDVGEYELYYRRFGTGDDVLLGLHGGPGMPHDYLLPLAAHGDDERSVVLYDQFGVGRSATPVPGDFDRYTVDHYRAEVDAVRDALGVASVDLYGQSWGGMLAQEYVLDYPHRVDTLVLANTLSDTQSAYESMRGFVDDLPATVRDTIEAHEARGAYDAPAYLEALDDVYANHVCRLDPYPDPVQRAFDDVATTPYGLMWGPNEYVLQEEARLRGWDVRDRLHEIEQPTLVLTGEYDEIRPTIAAEIADRIPDSTLHEFADASHMPLWERPDEHYDVVSDFLAR